LAYAPARKDISMELWTLSAGELAQGIARKDFRIEADEFRASSLKA
jgi:hypothetical protein